MENYDLSIPQGSSTRSLRALFIASPSNNAKPDTRVTRLEIISRPVREFVAALLLATISARACLLHEHWEKAYACAR